MSPRCTALAGLVVGLALAAEARGDGPSFDALFGLRPGASASDLERALGTPDAVAPGDDPVLSFAIHPFDPGEPMPASLDVTVCGDTGRVCAFAIDTRARDRFADRAPVLGVLGLARGELLERLGPPAGERPGALTWRALTDGAPSTTRLDVMIGPDDRADRLVVTWTVPTRPAPSRARLADFGRFAGLARGDHEDRARAILGPPSGVRVDASANRRRLEYPGLVVGIDLETDLVAYVSFGPAAEAFLAGRGLDEPNLWVLGKSPSHLRRHLGRTAPSDGEAWPWPSARAPKGRLTMMCGRGVVPTCDGAVVDWITPTRPAPLPALAVADFVRLGPLEVGDTEVELRQKLGEPARVNVLEDGSRLLTYGDGVLTVSLEPAGRVSLLMVGPGTGPWLAERALAASGDGASDPGKPDPRLALVGRKRAEVVRALGRPSPDSDRESPAWSTAPGAAQRVRITMRCYDFDLGVCNSLVVVW